ncbi:MAG: glutaminyl-peptide cyclotransferase [Acidobacteriaceae bacterium]
MLLFRRFLLALCCLLLATPVAFGADSYRVIRVYPHDPAAFVQGLCFSHGHLYESDGLYGQSSLREDDLQTGQPIKEISIPSRYFAEGLAPWGNELIQLTWKAHIGFVYDRKTFKLLRTFHYNYEGWGLTQDGHNLIESDGSDKLRFLNPETFKTVRILHVTYRGKPVTQLNELEYINGMIYSNVWMTNRIAIISPKTGDVVRWINLAGILPLPEERGPNAVLNGIAWNPATHQLLVTGKLWPKIFQIEVIPGKPGK